MTHMVFTSTQGCRAIGDSSMIINGVRSRMQMSTLRYAFRKTDDLVGPVMHLRTTIVMMSRTLWCPAFSQPPMCSMVKWVGR